MASIHIIANPVAGGGSAHKHFPRLAQLVSQANLDAVIHTTSERGHATRLAEQAVKDGCEVVVAAGGDGTVNEVINGLMRSRAPLPDCSPADLAQLPPVEIGQYPALGVLAIGRGNDFAQGAGAPETLEAGVQALVERKTRLVDIGKVYGGDLPAEGRYFGNCVGIGFDAMVTIQVRKMPRLGGFLSFFLGVLKTILVFYKGPTVQMDYNGQRTSMPTLMAAAMLGKRLGGGFWLAPNAKPDDGLLDMCLVEQISQFEILRLIPMFTKGTQEQHPAVRSARTNHLVITALQGGLPAHMDGEIICEDGKRLEMGLLPKQMEVITG